jgi:hypothetical protein
MLSAGQCTPERIKADEKLLADFAQVTAWQRQRAFRAYAAEISSKRSLARSYGSKAAHRVDRRGIGGLVAAIALRERGFEPVVFEQAGELKEVGAGIQITPNSTKILRAIGLEDAVRRHGFEPSFMLTRDMSTGEILFRTRAKGTMAERFGAGWFQIHRADLLEILIAALDGADIRLKARCVGVGPVDDGAIVEISGANANASMSWWDATGFIRRCAPFFMASKMCALPATCAGVR